MKSMMSSLQFQLKEKTEECSKLRAEVAVIADAGETENKINTKLKADLENSRKGFATKEAQNEEIINQLKEKVESAKEEVKKVEGKFDEEKKEYDSTITSLDAELDSLTEDYNDAESTIQQLRAELEQQHQNEMTNR